MIANRIAQYTLLLNSHKLMAMKQISPKLIFRWTSSSESQQLIKLEPDNVKKILEIFNGKDKEDLMRYPISKVRLAKIVSWKMKNGSFKTIDQFLEIDGFGIKMLEKFCQNILKYDENPIISSNSSATKQTRGFTIPTLQASSREHYKSCVSIFHSVSSVTWARITLNATGPCHLTHWQHFDLNVKRLHISDLIQNFRHLIRAIPEADCYVLENPQVAQATAPGSAEQLNINVQKSQMMAILNYALAERGEFGSLSSSSEHLRVFYLKKYLSGRVFNTLVGSERVSTEQVVTQLLRTDYNVGDFVVEVDGEVDESRDSATLRSNVNVPMDLRRIYHDAERYQRDFLGQALLIGMTFIRLCLLRTPESIAIVTRNLKDELDLEKST